MSAVPWRAPRVLARLAARFSASARRLAAALAVASSAFCSFAAGADVGLLAESSRLGITVFWDALTGSGMMEKSGHQISFRADDPFVLRDFRQMSLSDAPVLRDGTLFVTRRFMDDAERFFRRDESDGSLYRIGAILIDPGHGGRDPGAWASHNIGGKNTTVLEKDVNLAAAKILYARLRKAYPDKKILMTRSTDKYLSLDERTEIANSVKLKAHEAILFVSVHSNSHRSADVSGFEVWYLSPEYRRSVLDKDSVDDPALFPIMNVLMEEEFTMESILMAKFISDGLAAQVGSLSPNRNIKADEFFVVRNSKMPAVLVELGFVTNAAEAARLVDDSYLQKLSLGIYNGLAAFVAHFERSRGFTDIK